MEFETKVRNKVMRKVYALYIFRTLMKPRVRFIGLAVFAFIITASVSLKDIFANTLSAASSFERFFNYAADALVTTEVGVQVALLFLAVLAILALRDVCVFCITASVSLVRKEAHR